MVWRLTLIAFFVISAFSPNHAQTPYPDAKQQVRELLASGKYAEAKSLLVGNRELTREDKEGRFLLAVTNYHLHLHEEALTQLKALAYGDRYPFPECRLYLAKILHARHEFAEAAQQYKKYLKTLPDNNPYRRAVWNEVRRCQNGMELKFKTPLAFVENLGNEVNSSGDEFGPVPSPVFIDRLYFTAVREGNQGDRRDAYGNPDTQNGKFTADMYSCRLYSGKWSQVQPLALQLSTPRHEVLADLNSIGNVMAFFRGNTLQKGELLLDTFRQSSIGTYPPAVFSVPFDPSQGEVSFQWFSDSLILFASNQRGGFGGYDLFKTVLVDGRWTTPENLGAPINSAFDETSPFLLRDGKTLFFSSNNTDGSIGGLDIFKSHWDTDNRRWAAPQNLGLPVNSAADETHFRLSRDRFSAFFSSNRQGGLGQRDIYAAYFNEILEQEPEVEVAFMPPPPVAVSNTPTAPQNQVSLSDPQPAPPPKTDVALTPTPNPSPSGVPQDIVVQHPPSETPIPARPVVVQPAPSVIEPPAEIVRQESQPAAPASMPETAESAPRSVGNATVWKAADQILAKPDNFKEELDAISALLQRESDCKAVITLFVKKDNTPGVSLFAAMRTAEAVIAQLERKGIAPDRIFYRAVQAEWDFPEAGKYLLAFNWVPAPGKNAPPASLPAEVLSGITYEKKIDAPLVFKVQISSLKGENKNMSASRNPSPMVEKSYGVDYYRYTAGAFTTWTEAEQFRKTLIAQGVASAYITTYIYGYRMERNEARNYANSFPELQRFYNR